VTRSTGTPTRTLTRNVPASTYCRRIRDHTLILGYPSFEAKEPAINRNQGKLEENLLVVIGDAHDTVWTSHYVGEKTTATTQLAIHECRLDDNLRAYNRLFPHN